MSARLGEELDDAGCGGAGGGIGDGAPWAVEGPLWDHVLLRDRAELLAARVEDLPVDADGLLAAARIGEADAALHPVDVDGRAVGKLNASSIEALLQGGCKGPLAVSGRNRHGCHDHAGGLGARS